MNLHRTLIHSDGDGACIDVQWRREKNKIIVANYYIHFILDSIVGKSVAFDSESALCDSLLQCAIYEIKKNDNNL